jgi:hypothetical protein
MARRTLFISILIAVVSGVFALNSYPPRDC